MLSKIHSYRLLFRRFCTSYWFWRSTYL